MKPSKGQSDLQPFEHGEEETHACCDKRSKEEGGKAHCCYCVPHEGCEIDKPSKNMKNWEEYKKELLANPDVKKEYDKLEVAETPTKGSSEKNNQLIAVQGSSDDLSVILDAYKNGKYSKPATKAAVQALIQEAEQRGYEKAEVAQQNALNGLTKKHQRQAVEEFAEKLKKLDYGCCCAKPTKRAILVDDMNELLESDSE